MVTLRTWAIATALLTAVGCSASTESTEVGVRTINVSLIGGRGVSHDVYPQGGTYFFPRMLSEFDTFEVGVQNLAMKRETEDAIRFKTNDGNDVWVDLTVSWEIEADKAWYVDQFVGQDAAEVETKLVRPVARAIVRDVLNQLTSEEYYESDRRFATAEQAKNRLNRALQQEGIHIEQVLLGEHKFNDTYEALIRDKKVAEQEASRLNSETEAELEGKRREMSQLVGEIEKAKALALGESEKRKRDADAIRYEREQQAAAIRLEASAKAEGQRERAAALQGTGGVNVVKLKVADALKGKRILFIPAGSGLDMRSTDMNALLSAYGAMSAAKQKLE
jgi:regulator of protease activity HflC (stomatin/prohibitin superfamily)